MEFSNGRGYAVWTKSLGCVEHLAYKTDMPTEDEVKRLQQFYNMMEGNPQSLRYRNLKDMIVMCYINMRKNGNKFVLFSKSGSRVNLISHNYILSKQIMKGYYSDETDSEQEKKKKKEMKQARKNMQVNMPTP